MENKGKRIKRQNRNNYRKIVLRREDVVKFKHRGKKIRSKEWEAVKF